LKVLKQRELPRKGFGGFEIPPATNPEFTPFAVPPDLIHEYALRSAPPVRPLSEFHSKGLASIETEAGCRDDPLYAIFICKHSYAIGA
jgi:hypothetical protein